MATLGDNKVYALEEVIDFLQVTRRTAYRYIKEGKLKAVKVGGRWKVTDEAVKDFLQVK